MKKYKIVEKYKDFIIGKTQNGIFAIFTNELVNSVQPLYNYFTSIEEVKEFINML